MNGPVNPNPPPGSNPSPRRRPSQPQIILPPTATSSGQPIMPGNPASPSSPASIATNSQPTSLQTPPTGPSIGSLPASPSLLSRPLGPQGKVHLSTLCLVLLATFDLVTTLFWLHIGFGEGNPLFAAIAARFGGIGFAITKLVFVFVPVGILEFARTKRPMTAEIGTWVAFLAYGFLYLRHLVNYFGASMNL